MANRNKTLLAVAAAGALFVAAPLAEADADRWVQNRDGQWVLVDDDRDDDDDWDRDRDDDDDDDWDRSDKKREGGVYDQGNDGYGRSDKDVAELKMQIQRMDRNRDGVISRSEWKGRDEEFNRQDRNRDGRLTVSEMQTYGTRRVRNRNDVARQFDSLDRNQDGTVSRSEWRSARGDNYEFDRMDINRDGRIQRREMREMRTRRDDRWFR